MKNVRIIYLIKSKSIFFKKSNKTHNKYIYYEISVY